MSETVLVTGGAGFIGAHLVEHLRAAGKRVLVLDSLEPQVHGSARPSSPPEVELVVGDVRDRAVLSPLVERADVIVHLAAAVGLGQSMYQIERFVDVNVRGTAVLLEEVLRVRRARKLVLASSMSLYGEGRCRCARCGVFDPALRPMEQLARRDFELRCPGCGAIAEPVPTPEDARLRPTTVYAVTKRDQEELLLSVAAAYRIPAVALRLFNVYGPGQSLSNPYTGVAAIFATRILGGAAPLVFEDGRQTRDFTHVRDVARAFGAVIEDARADGRVFNVGSGRAHTLLELGALLAAGLGRPFAPEVSARFREGDIRHCSADGSALGAAIGFRAEVALAEGVGDLVAWARTQPIEDRAAQALDELARRDLVR